MYTINDFGYWENISEKLSIKVLKNDKNKMIIISPSIYKNGFITSFFKLKELKILFYLSPFSKMADEICKNGNVNKLQNLIDEFLKKATMISVFS